MKPSERGISTEARTLWPKVDRGSETRKKRPGEGAGGAHSKAVPIKLKWAVTCGSREWVASSRPYANHAIDMATRTGCKAPKPVFARTSR